MTFYKKFLHALMAGTQDLDTGDTYKIAFCTSAYTADLTDSGHDFFDDVSGVTETITLTGVSLSARVFDATGPTEIPDSDGGDAVTQAVLYKDTGGAGTSPLIAQQAITTYTEDGVAEVLAFNASGILRIGGA